MGKSLTLSLEGLTVLIFYGFILLNFISSDFRNVFFLILLLLAIINTNKLDFSVNKEELYLLSSYLFFFLITLSFYFYHESPISDIDNYSRFLFVIPLYFLFKSTVINVDDFIKVIIITALSIFILSSYLYFFNNPSLDRIAGLSSVSITYANMIMTIVVYLLITMFEKLDRKRKILIIFALACSILSWSLTMTKGSLIGLAFVLAYFFISKSFNFNKVYAAISFMAVILVLSFTPIHHSINSFYDDIKHIQKQELAEIHKDPNVSFSTKERIFLLVNAKEMILEKPFTGVGYQNFQKRIMDETYKNNRRYGMAQHDHAHNDFIDLWAKIGIFGFLALVLFYIVNLRFFLKAVKHSSNNYFAKIGVATLLSQLGFMLTQTQLSHHQPTLFFLVILIVVASQTIKSIKPLS
tara:strand:+ start:24765 stop:25994 length:1230 start_codon:yes stop_codon:yes gene_type:complete